ncbi:MAG: zinc ribbon domain-containing protein [Deltaproteobacteria bacterium]|nr:zinc ribbon domain-containing protein [Deltaproteobacteria bacterium]
MPIYEYGCEDCGEQFEVFQGINDDPVGECGSCKGTRVKKLVSNCSFQLKGSGWYLTDYARKENKDTSGQDSQNKEAPKATESGSSGSKETAKPKDSAEKAA